MFYLVYFFMAVLLIYVLYRLARIKSKDCDCDAHCDAHCGQSPCHCGTSPCHCGKSPCDFCSYDNFWNALFQKLKRYIVGEYSYVGRLYRKIQYAFYYFRPVAPVKVADVSGNRPRIAFVSVYGTPCGIATYNEELLKELRYYADVHVFAEYADAMRSVRLPSDPQWVTRCWDRLEHPKSILLAEIEKWQPDLVHFSHEYGLFPKAYMFTGLLSSLKIRGFKILATLHSVYEHLDKTFTEASVNNIMVHTYPAQTTLLKKGIPAARITVIPHGANVLAGNADSPELLPSLWNHLGSEHTIFQPGFLFGYKGHMRMLGVVANLKTKYADIHYIAQASENPKTQAEHDVLYAQLIAEVRRLGIEENVTINRGFVDMRTLLHLIRTVKVCVLPYVNHPDHDVRASSGAARVILGTSTPLVATMVHLFDDLEGIVPRAASDAEIQAEIEYIFTDPKAAEEQMAKRIAFLRKTSWPAVSHRIFVLYKKILES